MTITSPLTFPIDDVGLTNFKITPRNAVARTESPFSFADQVTAFSGEMWQISGTIPSCNRAIAEIYNSFLVALRGSYGTFLIGDPAARSPQGSIAGTPVVDGAGQSGHTLALRGFTSSATDVLKAGDYIQIGTGLSSRLYKVLVDVDADSSGDAVVDIWPRLRTSPADGTSIITTNTVGLFRMSSNTTPIEIRYPALYSGSFSAQEALNGS